MKKKKLVEKIKNDINEYTANIEHENFIEDETTCTIVIDLRTGPIYKEYSHNSLLCNDIFDFIDDTYRFVKKQKKLNFKIIYPSDTQEDEKNKIERIIKTHYAIEAQNSRKNTKKTNLLSGILLAIGSLFFLIYGYLEWKEVNFLYQGIIEIVSWVFVWEACYAFFFQNSSNKAELFNNLKKFEANIFKE